MNKRMCRWTLKLMAQAPVTTAQANATTYSPHETPGKDLEFYFYNYAYRHVAFRNQPI